MEQGRSANKVLLLNAITLEAAAADTQAFASRTMLDVSNSDNLALACKYTVGATETNNTASILVYAYGGTKGLDSEILADTANWFQIGVTTTSSGTATFAGTSFNIVGASATTYTAYFTVPITASKIMIAASESGVATNKGTLTVVAIV
jgi:hypothetical protein